MSVVSNGREVRKGRELFQQRPKAGEEREEGVGLFQAEGTACAKSLVFAA